MNARNLLFVCLLSCLTIFELTRAECPNQCNGHGTCDDNEQCLCHKNTIVKNKEGNVDNVFMSTKDTPNDMAAAWTGADCSRHTCPRGTSWIQVPSARFQGKDTFCTHKKSVECSDKGVCDRKSGQCNCFAGYTGAACQRTECPNDCNGHGVCQSNVKFAEDATRMMQPHAYGKDNINAVFDYIVTYDQAWDSDLHFGCKCDLGYTGPDCSLKECPSAHDRLDEKCTIAEDSRDGGLVEFIGEEFFYSNPASDFIENVAPLPNKNILYVDNYINNPALHMPKDVTQDYWVALANAKEGKTADNTNSYTSYKGFCKLNTGQDGTDATPLEYTSQDSDFYPFYLDSKGDFSYSKNYSAEAGVRPAGYSGNNLVKGKPNSALGPFELSPGKYAAVISASEAGNYQYKDTYDYTDEIAYARCVKGRYCGGKTSGETCSGRGLCDHTKGKCQCFQGYTGNACQDPINIA